MLPSKNLACFPGLSQTVSMGQSPKDAAGERDEAPPCLHQSHPTLSTRRHPSHLWMERQLLTPWHLPSRCSTDGKAGGSTVSASLEERCRHERSSFEQCVKSYSFFLTPAPRNPPEGASLPSSIWLIIPSCLIRKAGESRELELPLSVLAPGRNSRPAWVPSS